jgi:1-acyl-sn-glycerol-3-phosphate acyltransferase
MQSLCYRLCELHRWDLDVVGVFPKRAAVVVANHQSYVDPVVICAAHPCLPIAKSEVASWPVVGPATRALGVQFMQRGKTADGARMLRDVLSTLERGASILNFPEGTTTRASLRAFSPGIFGIARHAGVPVIPVFVRLHQSMPWVGDDEFLPHYLSLVQRALSSRGRCRLRVEVGPELEPSQVGGTRSLMRAAHDWIAGRVAETYPTGHRA